MKLFDKLNRNIDYNNFYTIKRAISILEDEFMLAEKNKNILLAREVLNTAEKIYQSYKDGKDYSYMQKLWSGRLRQFIDHLNKCLNIIETG